jgi:hypothetical protein
MVSVSRSEAVGEFHTSSLRAWLAASNRGRPSVDRSPTADAWRCDLYRRGVTATINLVSERTVESHFGSLS